MKEKNLWSLDPFWVNVWKVIAAVQFRVLRKLPTGAILKVIEFEVSWKSLVNDFIPKKAFTVLSL